MIDLPAFYQRCVEYQVPCISLATQDRLRELLLTHRPQTIVEIGSAVGFSSCFMSSILPEALIYTFDVSYRQTIQLMQTISEYKIPNIISYPFGFETVADLRLLIPSPIDFLFVDARKSDYHLYIQHLLTQHYALVDQHLPPLVTNETIIVFDDVQKYHNKVYSLYELFATNQVQYSELPLDKDDGVWITSWQELLKIKP